jgi:hypothetical protein
MYAKKIARSVQFKISGLFVISILRNDFRPANPLHRDLHPHLQVAQMGGLLELL